MKKFTLRKFFIFSRRNLMFAWLLLFAFSLSAFPATLTEYRDNIVHLRGDLDLMIAPDEDSTAADNRAFETDVLAEFPKLLPARDKIEWNGASFETNNQWIYDALAEFEKEPSSSPKRKVILIKIEERLAAVEKKLDELETVTTSVSKDENKRKLAEILRREAYQKPEKPDRSFLEKLYLQILEWIAKVFPSPNIAPSESGGFQSLYFVLQMLLYAVILGALGFLIYRFAPFFIDKYRLKEKTEKKDRVILGERLTADETAQTLFGEAERLAREGNLRGAIRKGYIALLCELSDKKIIGLSQHKTNRDYLRDVRQKSDLHQNMSGLTSNYERHWYGFENAETKDWEEFRNGYRRAVGGQK